MTYYELYINDILCDLSSDNYISLVYQSPIFSGLDIIQSNRSYNIDLPLTPKNRKAIGYAERTDIYTDAPYVKLPARLYQEGVPLFTSGYAVITEISDVISVVLTWGNVDNFQSLFDANLRDLAQTLYSMNIGSIPWNSASALLEYGYDRPQMGFFGIDFGQGIANPEYMHPSIEVQDVLTAIERYNGITIDGKERLYGGLTYPLLLPLVSKNGDEVSNKAEALTARPYISAGHVTFRSTSNFNTNLHDIRGLVLEDSFILSSVDVSGAEKVVIEISGAQGSFSINLAEVSFDKLPASLEIKIMNQDGEVLYRKSNTNRPTSRVYVFDNIKTTISTTGNYILSIEVVDPSTGGIPPESTNQPQWTIKIIPNWEDVVFPSEYPIGVNLPDISQGDFLSALMSMAGLFAYPDKDAPDTIKLISVDDIYAITNRDTIDWSRKVILNDRHDVSRPESSIFSLDDLAQKNTLDYDNDDDVITDTAGEIRIENVNIDKENELVELPFSASESAPLASDANALCARIPMYTTSDDGKTVDYNEPSARILQAIIDDTSTGLYWFGYFGENMRFGGENGIVAKKYSGYQKAVDKLRLITVKVKLTAIDLHNLDYTKPIYIGQFGQRYGLYSVETGENGICECQLIQLQAIKEVVVPDYYLTINGSASDISRAVGSSKTAVVFTYQTNGTIQVASQSGMFENIAFASGILSIGVKKNTATELRTGELVVSVKEAPGITRTITVQQAAAEPEPAASRPLKLHLTVTDNEGAPLVTDEVTASYILPSGDSKLERWADTDAVDVTLEASTEYMTLGFAATKAGYTGGKKQIDIPAGTAEYSVTETLILTSEQPITSRNITLDITITDNEGQPVDAESVDVKYTNASGVEVIHSASGALINDTLQDVTTDSFIMTVSVTTPGYVLWQDSITVNAGTEQTTVIKQIALTASEPPIEGRNLHVVLSIEDADGSPLAADKVTVTTKDAAGQTVTREYTNTSAVDDTIADIPTSGSSVTVTASKSGYNDGWIQGSIPSGSSDYTYTGVVPLRSSRTVGAGILVRDAKGSPVVADEIACTYLQSSGKTNTIRTTNSSHLDYGGYSDCSVKAFTSRITVTAADYADAVEEVPVEAGAEAVTIRKTVTLSPGSRSLHLDFAVRNEQGAAVEDAVVVIQYVKPDGSDENLQFTGGVHETFDNATTQGFTLLIIAQAEGSRMHMQEIAVPAGKEAYTYDTDVVLYYDYSPGITLDPPSPWTSTAHLGTLRNTGNVDLELLSAPEWCTITGDVPGTVAIGEGRALAVSKNETGGRRTGTISMRYRNVESSEDVTYDVEVSQEP